MPNEYSNFTTPDSANASGGYNRNPDDPNDPNRGTGPDGSTWDPNGGPNGTGAYIPMKPSAAPSAPVRTFEQGAWGGQGDDMDYQGNAVGGTSGAARDAGRYQDMGQDPLYTSGPQIDQTASDESRGLSMGGIDLLKNTAEGTSPSVAEQLGTKMGQDAANGVTSMGASVRGGAMARAAAGRQAQAQGTLIQGQQRQANAATRAGEMAGARGAYLGAASGQRGEDLGEATSQAQLNEGQNAANDQREAFYEGLAQNTKNSELSHELGRTAEQDNASNAAFQTNLAGKKQDAANAWKNVNTAVGGASGAAQGYDAVTGGSNPQMDPTNPYDSGSDNSNPDPDTDSDERMKTGITPVGDFDTQLAAEDEPKFKEWKAQYAPKDSGADYDLRGAFRAGLKPDAKTGHWPDTYKKPNHPTFSDESIYAAAGNPGHWKGDKFVPPAPAAPAEKRGSAISRVTARVRKMSDDANPYDSSKTYDNSMFRSNKADLDAAIGARVAADSAVKMDPTNPYDKAGKPSDAVSNPGAYKQNALGSVKNYAASRKGQPGYMFGGAPQASYGNLNHLVVPSDEQSGMAPGTADFASSEGPVTDPKSRRIMQSDIKTKDGCRPLTPEEKAQDEADTKKFMGDGPGVYKAPSTPEEAKEELNKAAFEARERVRQQKIDADKAENHAAAEWVDRNDAEQAREIRSHKMTPQFIREWAASGVENRRFAPEAERADRARQYVSDNEAAERRKHLLDGIVPEFAKPYIAQTKKPTVRQPTSFTRDPDRATADITTSDEKAKNKSDGYKGLRELGTADDSTLLWDQDGGGALGHSAIAEPGENQAKASMGASLSGPAPKFAHETEKTASAPKPVARASAPKTRKYTDAELERLAAEMQANTQAQTDAMHSQGSSVQGALARSNEAPTADPDSWLDRYMTSDKRTKTNSHDEGPMAKAMRTMKPYSYEYKPQFAGQNGQHVGDENVGPMANPMAKDPVAKTAIVKDPNTGLLGIDKAKGLKLALGGLADLQRQVDELKKKRR